ncbi:hypothetical protein [Methanothermobacter thermautotrophicus]|jgi:hypothetical protein|nr:hypothetical protein [Methanothermobacter thermautotrophicus]
MEIYRFVYTKVPPEESPWGIRDFHTVFYPVDLISREDLHEIERMIHKPQIDGFKDKLTVFYMKMDGRDYLAILYLTDLPEERDVFGRGGLFLCHGFLFPPELWMMAQTPLELFDMVKDKVFEGIEDLLNSDAVNKSTGNIEAIEVSSYPPSGDRRPPLSDDFKLKMALYLFKMASGIHESPPLILDGNPSDVSDLINEVLFYIPDELKVNLGWDSAFDGGSIYHHPLKILGFSEERPYGKNPVLVNLDNRTVDCPGESSGLLYPHSSYERWLENCDETVSKEDINAAYRLSLLLDSMEPPSSVEEVMPQLENFGYINRDPIEGQFRRKFHEVFGMTLTDPDLPPGTMLKFLIEGPSCDSMAGFIESLVLDGYLTEEDIELPLEVTERSRILRIIQRLWDGADISDELMELDSEESRQLFPYLIGTGLLMKNEPLKDLLRDDEDFKALSDEMEDLSDILNSSGFSVSGSDSADDPEDGSEINLSKLKMIISELKLIISGLRRQ